MNLTLESFILLAVLIEAAVQAFKFLYDPEKRFYGVVDGKLKVDIERLLGIAPNVVALLFGTLVAVLADASLFDMVGIPLKAPGVGYVLTGVIASRGSSMAHELYSSLRKKPVDILPGGFPGGG